MVKTRRKPQAKKPDEAVDMLKSLANHYYIRDDRIMCELTIELLHTHYERKFEPFDVQLDDELNADEACSTTTPPLE